MCPVCGTLLELAESPQAQREKAFVARLVAEGRSKDEIKDALVAEYGEEVLALPEDSGFDLSAYLVPIVAFVLAAIALALGVCAGAGPAAPPDPTAARPGGPERRGQRAPRRRPRPLRPLSAAVADDDRAERLAGSRAERGPQRRAARPAPRRRRRGEHRVGLAGDRLAAARSLPPSAGPSRTTSS